MAKNSNDWLKQLPNGGRQPSNYGCSYIWKLQTCIKNVFLHNEPIFRRKKVDLELSARFKHSLSNTCSNEYFQISYNQADS